MSDGNIITGFITTVLKDDNFLAAVSSLVEQNNPALRMYRDGFLLNDGEAVVPGQAVGTLIQLIEMELEMLKKQHTHPKNGADLWGTAEYRQICENAGRISIGLMVAAGMTAATLALYDNILEGVQDKLKEDGLNEQEMLEEMRG